MDSSVVIFLPDNSAEVVEETDETDGLLLPLPCGFVLTLGTGSPADMVVVAAELDLVLTVFGLPDLS